MQILFKKYKINNYSFFKAISYKSDFIKNVMNTNFIAKYPPCFRCHKNECNCSNNMLINKQVANFFSFINLMKIIQKKKNNKLFMICEDDIEFTKSGIFNINYILNNNNFDYNKPILIRLAKGFCKNHSLNKTPYLNKNIIMSNPCFLINSYYAITFLKI